MTAAGNVMIWPAAPIAWDGLVGTWPISVWSTGPIGGLAFDTAGMALTGVSLVGMPNVAPMPITNAFLNAFMPAPGTLAAPAPLFSPAGVLAPSYGFAGAYDPFVPTTPAFGFGAFAPGVGLSEFTMVDGALAPGFQSWLTPTLTNSALLFTDVAAVDVFTPLTFNVTFTAASAAQVSAMQAATAAGGFGLPTLSIFATPVGLAGLGADPIPFTSMVYPVGVPLLPMGAGALPVAPAAPLF